ncbi:MAG: hypothetical protein RJA99_2262 [Pseudomonadota bacterium]|jgi:hypothetical protein
MTARSFRPVRGFLPAALAAALACGVLAPDASAQAVPKAATAQGAPAPSKAAAADPHRRDDIARHRAIAAAHETAARCLEAGQPESDCHAALRKACEGLAVGRYCGMKHSH